MRIGTGEAALGMSGGDLSGGCAGSGGSAGSGTLHFGSAVPFAVMPLNISGPAARVISTRHMLDSTMTTDCSCCSMEPSWIWLGRMTWGGGDLAGLLNRADGAGGLGGLVDRSSSWRPAGLCVKVAVACVAGAAPWSGLAVAVSDLGGCGGLGGRGGARALELAALAGSLRGGGCAGGFLDGFACSLDADGGRRIRGGGIAAEAVTVAVALGGMLMV